MSRELIELATAQEVNRKTTFGEVAAAMDAVDLGEMYEELAASAPRRHSRNKRYFVGHNGVPSTVGKSNRKEEHLAIALCNGSDTITLGAANTLTLLDYQVPLKARQTDSGVGKVDLVGATGSGDIAVVELKVTTATSSGDTPLRALLEAFAYCAIIEANAHEISAEIAETYGLDVDSGRPCLVVMGPERYWSAWPSARLAAVYGLSDRLAETLGMHIWFVNLGNVDVATGSAGNKPQLLGTTSHDLLHSTERNSED